MNSVYISLSDVLLYFLYFSIGVGAASAFIQCLLKECPTLKGKKESVLYVLITKTLHMFFIGAVFVGTLNISKRRDLLESVLPVPLDVLYYIVTCVLIVAITCCLFCYNSRRCGYKKWSRVLSGFLEKMVWICIVLLVLFGLLVVGCMFL